MWKAFLLTVLAYLVWVLYSVFLPALGTGPFPNLPLCFVLTAGIFLGSWAGGLSGLLFGLALESNAAVPFLVYALPFSIAGLVAGMYRRGAGSLGGAGNPGGGGNSGGPWWRQVLAAATLCLLVMAAVHIMFSIWSMRANAAFSISYAIFHIVLPEMGLTLLCTLLCLAAASVWRANRR